MNCLECSIICKNNSFVGSNTSCYFCNYCLMEYVTSNENSKIIYIDYLFNLNKKHICATYYYSLQELHFTAFSTTFKMKTIRYPTRKQAEVFINKSLKTIILQ